MVWERIIAQTGFLLNYVRLLTNSKGVLRTHGQALLWPASTDIDRMLSVSKATSTQANPLIIYSQWGRRETSPNDLLTNRVKLQVRRECLLVKWLIRDALWPDKRPIRSKQSRRLHIACARKSQVDGFRDGRAHDRWQHVAEAELDLVDEDEVGAVADQTGSAVGDWPLVWEDAREVPGDSERYDTVH